MNFNRLCRRPGGEPYFGWVKHKGDSGDEERASKARHVKDEVDRGIPST